MAAKFKLGDLITPRIQVFHAHVGIIYRVVSYNGYYASLRLMEEDKLTYVFTIARCTDYPTLESIVAQFDLVTSPTCFDIPSANINFGELL